MVVLYDFSNDSYLLVYVYSLASYASNINKLFSSIINQPEIGVMDVHVYCPYFFMYFLYQTCTCTHASEEVIL